MATPSWMSGYVGDVSYTLGFYRETAPSFLNYVCAINGFAGIGKREGLRYCELGCGRGYGTALLAAANPDGAFLGIDFNPSHVDEARKFAALAGVDNVTFIESDFANAARAGGAQAESFDVVALHGVYSWVSQDVRESIHEFLRNRLAPGGIAYISYNTFPGWSAAAPVQRILKEYSARTSGDILRRIAAGRAALATLVEKGSLFIAQNPSAKQRIAMMDQQQPQYVAHEFLNEFWEPLYVTEAMAALAEAKLTYAGSATIGENRHQLCVPADLIPLVQSAPDPALRELLKDYAINKQFRRDVYIKGPTRISGADAARHYDALTFALTLQPKTVPQTWRVPTGTVTAKSENVETILSHLANGPATAGALRAMGKAKGMADGEIAVILDVLIHNNVVNPCRPDFAEIDRTPAQRLNKAVIDLALADDSHRFMAAPVLGSAIAAPYFERLSLPVVIENNGSSDKEVATKLFDRFATTGKGVLRDGKPIERDDKTEAELAEMVKTFRESSLPRWRELGVEA